MKFLVTDKVTQVLIDGEYHPAGATVEVTDGVMIERLTSRGTLVQPGSTGVDS